MKHRAWLLPLLLAVLLGAAACAGGRSPATTAPPQPPASPPPKTESAPAAVPADDIAKWKATVAREPTADNWNELSFAHIKAQQWEAAVQAGQEALKLKPDHPYALFNTGLALVKWGKPMEALTYLKQTAAMQPDRHEPQLLLAQAYQQLGHYLLASYYARQAVSLSKQDPEAVQTERSVAGMLAAKPPADLATNCASRFSDGGFSLCLYPETPPGQSPGQARRYTLWYGPAGEQPRPIPIGYAWAEQWGTVPLPGGGKGYWLCGGSVGALVAATDECRLFVREGSGLRQILFLGGDQYEGAVSDFMRGSARLPIKDGEISTSHRDDITGTRTIETTRRLSLAEGTVTVVTVMEIIRGPVIQVVPKVAVKTGYDYKWAYDLAEGASIGVDGRPATAADLKVGMYATIIVQNGKITEIAASSK